MGHGTLSGCCCILWGSAATLESFMIPRAAEPTGYWVEQAHPCCSSSTQHPIQGALTHPHPGSSHSGAWQIPGALQREKAKVRAGGKARTAPGTPCEPHPTATPTSQCTEQRLTHPSSLASPLLSSHSTFTSTNPQQADPAQAQTLSSLRPSCPISACPRDRSDPAAPVTSAWRDGASLPFIGSNTPKLLSRAVSPPTCSLCLLPPPRPGPQTTWLAFLWPGQRLKPPAVNARIVPPQISPFPHTSLPPLRRPLSGRGCSPHPQHSLMRTLSSPLLPAINSNEFLPPTQGGHFILHRGVESGLTSLEFIHQVKRERKRKVCWGQEMLLLLLCLSGQPHR